MSGSGREAILNVRGVVGRPSQMSENGREALSVVR